MKEKVVIVHGLAEARIALAVAKALGRPLILASGPAAAGYAGTLWFRELLRRARAEAPEVEVTGLLDCGDKPGLVLGALDQGLPLLRFSGPRRTAETLAEICEARGVRLVTTRLKALDLGTEPDPEGACRDWLTKP